jgi:subtilisin-like proprotein convertase family protein
VKFLGAAVAIVGLVAFAVDPLLDSQWHLKARSAEVAGANVVAEWSSTRGAGVVIGIVDDGLQRTHPDLEPNYVSGPSYDFNFDDPDPSPDAGNKHGTAVAGVAGARDDNGMGVAGAAPRASLAGLRLIAAGTTDAQDAAALNYQPNAIHIASNSWGPADDGMTLDGPGPLTRAAIASAVTNGRDGKGRIFTWAAGNGRGYGDDCNFDGYANQRYVIAVGALADTGQQASYSESCSALLVSAPSNGGSRAITTTDLVGSAGYSSGDYTSSFGGTSSATPLVAGAVALMLARNPNLTWRDVQHILRRSSFRLNPTDAGWTTGEFPHNEKYGFGQLDATAAADMAATWTSVGAELSIAPASRSLNVAIPDNDATGVSDSIAIASAESGFTVEHVEVEFTATHPYRGDLRVTLTSPGGVVSTLAPVHDDPGNDFSQWRFSSVRHWGESPIGTWRLNVSDRVAADPGTWNSWTLRVYGWRNLTGDTPVSGLVLASHITDLRQRINAVRAARGLAAFSFTDPTLTAGATRIRAVHITELRTALAQAYTAAGLTPPTYTDPGLAAGFYIKAVHINELRTAVRALE